MKMPINWSTHSVIVTKHTTSYNGILLVTKQPYGSDDGTTVRSFSAWLSSTSHGYSTDSRDIQNGCILSGHTWHDYN